MSAMPGLFRDACSRTEEFDKDVFGVGEVLKWGEETERVGK